MSASGYGTFSIQFDDSAKPANCIGRFCQSKIVSVSFCLFYDPSFDKSFRNALKSIRISDTCFRQSLCCFGRDGSLVILEPYWVKNGSKSKLLNPVMVDI